MSTSAADILNAASGAFAGAQADTGAGLQGEWPPEGEHDCLITSLDIKADQFRQGRTVLANHPCAVVQFSYKRIDNPTVPNYVKDDPANQIEFNGREMQIVSDPKSLPNAEGSKPDSLRTAAERDLRRLKGHLSVILRRPESELTDLAACISQAQEAINSGRTIATVKCDYYTPEGKTTTYKTDYLRGLVSG